MKYMLKIINQETVHIFVVGFLNRYFILIVLQIDKLGYTTDDTFMMRYLMNDSFWGGPSSPIFFYAGNEGDVTGFANNTVRAFHRSFFQYLQNFICFWYGKFISGLRIIFRAQIIELLRIF